MLLSYFKTPKNPGFYRELMVTLATCFSFFMFGITRSYTSFALPQLLSKNYTSFPVTEEEGTWIACFLALMNPLGCFLGGILMDTVGRKIALLSGFLPLAVSWGIIALATNVEMVYVGVIGLGIGVGITFCCVTYVAEITMPQNRGMLLSLMDPAYLFGILLCNVLVDYLIWYRSAAIFVAISAYAFVCLLFIPESPLWLLSKSNSDPEAALKNLSWLRNKPAHEVYPELEKLQLFMNDNYRHRTIKQYLSIIRQSLSPLVMLIVLAILQQGTGYTVMVGYTVLFFEELHLPYDCFKVALWYSAVGFLSSFFIPWIIERFRRKTLLTLSATGMAVTMFVIAIYDYRFAGVVVSPKPFAWIPVLASYVYVVSSNYGVFPLPFIIGGEVFPMHVRGVMQGVFGAACFCVIAIIIKLFPEFLLSYGVTPVAGILGLFSVLTALYGKFVLPETKGKSLQDIREDFNRDD